MKLRLLDIRDRSILTIVYINDNLHIDIHLYKRRQVYVCGHLFKNRYLA